jgi:transposase
VHSHYTRTFADLPWQGRTVMLQVRARRLRCTTPSCPQRIFAERLVGVARPHGRRTDRLGDVQRHLGLALGGEAGARLAERLSLPVSAATLLRLVRSRAMGRPGPVPRVLGVDDWAWRRGQRYGTILCDLERRKVIDLLPDRAAAPLAAWLHDHPGVEIVARDRAGAYADGVQQGAPNAIQVADRWHLLRNCSDALLQVLDRHRGAFGRVANGMAREADDGVSSPEIGPATKREKRQEKRQADRNVRFNTVAALARAGLGVRAIARETGLARNTVRRWLREGAAPTWRKGERSRITDPFRPYLRQRLSEGMGNATRLWREITNLGFRGQVITVRRAVAQLKGGSSRPKRSPAPVWRRPTPRRTARALLSDRVGTEMDQRFYDALLAAVPEVRRAVEEVRAFIGLVRERNRDALAPWLERARGGPLSGFAEGLRRDHPAVVAALVHPWSTGPVEGQINRLKTLKRQMYGRAKLDLLGRRFLLAA